MKKIRTLLFYTNILVLLLLLFVTLPICAQEFPDPTNPSLIPPSGQIGGSCDFWSGQFLASCIPAYLRYLIRLAFMFIGAFFLLMIIISGYTFALGSITGEGKDLAMTKLRYAIVGFMICAFAFFIIDFFINALATGV